MKRKPSVSFIICIAILTVLLVIATLIPNEPVRFIGVVICYILWFIAGFIQGIGTRYWKK